MQHIETIELGSSQSSITFSSIPQDYDDLVLKISARSDRAAEVASQLDLLYNSSTANHSSVRLYGSGSSVGSTTDTRPFAGIIPASASTTNTFSSETIYISNYTATQAKSISTDSVMENNATQSFQDLVAGLWNDTSAITSLEVVDVQANFVSGSTFSLYGVTAGGDGTVTTS